MERWGRWQAALAMVLGLCGSAAVHASAVVTVRLTSLEDLLRDAQAMAAIEGEMLSRETFLGQIAAAAGVEDLSFVDLARPVVLALPEEGMLAGARGMVLVVPVRDGFTALDALSRSYPDRSVESDLTVLRRPAIDSPDEQESDVLYASVRGRSLLVGREAVAVRALDPSSLPSSGELPAGTLAVSLEAEPVRGLVKSALAAGREQWRKMVGSLEPPGPAAGASSGAADAEEILDDPILVTDDVVPPELVVRIEPRYPEELRLERIEGSVALRAVIDAGGSVTRISVDRSTDPRFESPAIEAVKQWRYRPAMRGDEPVSVDFSVLVEFKLRGRQDTEAAGGNPPLPFDPRKLGGFVDLYFDLLVDTIDSVSRLQISIELDERYLIVHGRGVERPGSTLAGFIAAQRDVGLPAIGRVLPAHAPMLVAGRVAWTEPSRAWFQRLLERYRAAMGEMFEQLPEDERADGRKLLEGMKLWNSDRIFDCHGGDLALATDYTPGDMQMLQLWGLSGSEACHDVLASVVSSASFLDEELLEPEGVRSWVGRLRTPASLGDAGTIPAEGVAVRYAEVGDAIISGTDDWATRAIRDAAQAREGGTPGRGGLLLGDLGPFAQGPGVFGRMQLGTLMRQQAETTADESSPSPELLRALEGPAGEMPFAMRFDDRAATVEIALPRAMFEAFAEHAPADEGDEEDDEP